MLYLFNDIEDKIYIFKEVKIPKIKKMIIFIFILIIFILKNN